MIPEFETARLILRPLAPRDVDPVFAIMSDPEAMRFWDWPAFREPASVRDLIASQLAQMRAGTAAYWAVCLKGADGAIGSCDFSDIDRYHRRAEIGFAFHRAYWGNGYAFEAMSKLVTHALSDMELERLHARLHAGNEACRRLLERLGFHFEGRLAGHVVRDGHRRDCLLYGRLQAD